MTDNDIIKEINRVVITASKVRSLVNQSLDRMHELEADIHVLVDDLHKRIKDKRLRKRRKK